MKNKRTKMILIWIVSLLLALAAVKGCLVLYSTHASEEQWETVTLEAEVEAAFLDEDSGITAIKMISPSSKDDLKDDEKIETSDFFQVQGFFVVQRCKYKRLDMTDSSSDWANAYEVDYFYIDCYKFIDDELSKVKTIDLLNLTQSRNEKLLPQNCSSSNFSNGAPLIEVSLYHKDIAECPDLYIDLDSEEVFKRDELTLKEKSPEETKQYVQSDLQLLEKTNVGDKLKEMGIDIDFYPFHESRVVSVEPEYLSGDVYAEKEDRILPRKKGWKDIKLLKEYPQLKDFFDVKKDDTNVKIFIDSKMEDEAILNLFMEKGEDFFKDAVLPSRNCIREIDMEINSIEDFRKWYEYSEQNYARTKAKEEQEWN